MQYFCYHFESIKSFPQIIKQRSSILNILYFRDQMRNSFNFLLIGLLCFDSSFLCGVLLDMVRKAFFGKIFVTDIHTILFPYVFYPASVIFMTASICMTAAMALERFIAVHYPIGKLV